MERLGNGGKWRRVWQMCARRTRDVLVVDWTSSIFIVCCVAGSVYGAQCSSAHPDRATGLDSSGAGRCSGWCGASEWAAG